MKELENILNSLIKMGWKPFGMEINAEHIDRIIIEWSTMRIIFKWDWEHIERLRTLVSQESWLWQFVVENGMIKGNDDVRIKNYRWDNECDTNCCYDDYEYRLIESALVPEEGLGKFLVDNILIDG